MDTHTHTELLSFHIIEGAVFRKELEATDSIGESPDPLTGQRGRVEPIKLKTLPGQLTVFGKTI